VRAISVLLPGALLAAVPLVVLSIDAWEPTVTSHPLSTIEDAAVELLPCADAAQRSGVSRRWR
jgi:hypothetical protein